MDDLTVTTSLVPGSRWILQGLERLISWVRMSFKPAKSRSLVLKKGKVVDKFRFKISETTIPTLSEKPVKSLGKVFDCNLKDKVAIQRTCGDLGVWLTKVVWVARAFQVMDLPACHSSHGFVATATL